MCRRKCDKRWKRETERERENGEQQVMLLDGWAGEWGIIMHSSWPTPCLTHREMGHSFERRPPTPPTSGLLLLSLSLLLLSNPIRLSPSLSHFSFHPFLYIHDISMYKYITISLIASDLSVRLAHDFLLSSPARIPKFTSLLPFFLSTFHVSFPNAHSQVVH